MNIFALKSISTYVYLFKKFFSGRCNAINTAIFSVPQKKNDGLEVIGCC